MDDLTQERYPGASEAAAEVDRPPPPRPREPADAIARHRRVLLGQDDDTGPAP